MGRWVRQGFSLAATACALGFSLPTEAASERARAFDIPAMDLGPALIRFGLATHSQVIFSQEVVRGRRSQPLSGRFEPQDALTRLIGDPSMKATIIPGGVILISRPAAAIAPAPVEPGPRPAARAPTRPDTTAIAPTALEEVVVYARKRPERAQNVPASVLAVPARLVELYDLTSLERLSAATPQLIVGRAVTGSGAQLVLRGVGSSYTSVGIEQSVATVLDGAYYGQGRAINEAFLDLARVEVLRGPQALFFGKNATAGVVALTTADPTSTFEGFGRVAYEADGRQAYGEAVISGPLSGALGARLAVRASHMWSGYFINRATPLVVDTQDIATGATTPHLAPAGARNLPGDGQVSGRLTLRLAPTDQFSAVLKVSASQDRSDNPASNYVVFSCPSGVAQNNAAITCGRAFRVQFNDLPADMAALIRRAGDGGLYNRYRSAAATGTLNYETSALTLNSVTNLQWNANRLLTDVSFVSSPTAHAWVTNDSHWRAVSSEGRALTRLAGPLNALVGFYFQDSRLRYGEEDITERAILRENSAAPNPADRYLTRNKLSTTNGKTSSVFGQLIWTAADTVEVTGGARYTRETKTSAFVQPYVLPPLTAVLPQGLPLDAGQTFRNWSPEITFRWGLTPQVTVYGAYKTGYKSGGFSNNTVQSRASTTAGVAFGPERAEGVEAGLKATLLADTLRLNLGAYSYRYRGLQVDYFNPVIVAFITTNAGSAATAGAEMDAEWAPAAIRRLTLRGSANYNKARYRNFNGPCFAGQTPAEGCVLEGPNGAWFQDLRGKPLLNAPRWTGALGFTYEVPTEAGAVLQVSADARYSSAYLASNAGNPSARQPAYVALDAAVSAHTADGGWEMALVGKNLTNRFVINGAFETAYSGGGTGTAAGVRADLAGLVALPRTVQMRLTRRF